MFGFSQSRRYHLPAVCSLTNSSRKSPGQNGRGGMLRVQRRTFFFELKGEFAGFGRGDFHAMTGFEAGVLQPQSSQPNPRPDSAVGKIANRFDFQAARFGVHTFTSASGC